MPQLDLITFKSQSFFLIIFLFGYFLFLKHILSMLSFELKYKAKLELFYLRFSSKVLPATASSNKLILLTLMQIANVLKITQYIIEPQKFVFGLYPSDLLILKIKFKV